jgi:hypothetical protein
MEIDPICFDGGELCNTGAIKGRLMSFGEPVAGAVVGVSLAFIADPDTFRTPPVNDVPVPAKTTRSDRNGQFWIDGLTPGNYMIDPAFCETDGYVLNTFSESLAMRCVVVEGDTCDAGALELMRAINPVAPANRSTVQDSTPEFRWTAAYDPPGMTFVGYIIQYGRGYVMDRQMSDIMEPRWQMPVSMAISPGEYVRWNVIARAFNPASGDTVDIGEFEWPATFSVDE